jgi:hypothetical protein
MGGDKLAARGEGGEEQGHEYPLCGRMHIHTYEFTRTRGVRKRRGLEKCEETSELQEEAAVGRTYGHLLFGCIFMLFSYAYS